MSRTTRSTKERSKNEGRNGKKQLWERVRGQFQMRPPDDDDHQDWWLASTAIPLVAAATAPLANLMSIIALAMPWRNNIHLDKDGVDGTPVEVGYDDPRWCTALNATSLACGVIGNIFFMCNFTRILRYIIALPMSIFLWLLSAAILAGLTVSIHLYGGPTLPNQTYSQAYWSAVISAVLYFLLSVILVINMLGYFLGHYPQNFALTDDQRTLILQTISLVVWLAVGGAIYSKVIGISYADGVYFSDITILTLGFGDITNSNSVGRGLVLPYAVIGMIMLGLVVSSIHRFAQEIHRDTVMMNHIKQKRKAVIEGSASGTRLEYRQRHTRRRSITSVVSSFHEEDRSRSRLLRMKEEKDRFNAMRAIQNETARYRRWTSLLISIIIYGIVWTCGAVVFWVLEDDMTYFEALYFGFCCLLTIGYGDFTPKTNAGRPFFIVWSLLAIPTMTMLISKMSDTLVYQFKKATSFVATWTFLPQSGQYRAILARFPGIANIFLAHSSVTAPQASSQEIETLKLEKGPHQEFPREERTIATSLEDLASDSNLGPSDSELAQQLATAINEAVKDCMSGEPRKYTYEEWAAFTRLIQFTYSRRPGEMVLDEDEYGMLHWDWIGENSPMLAEKTEPEWVLDRLVESLMRYVAMQGQGPQNGLRGEERERRRSV